MHSTPARSARVPIASGSVVASLLLAPAAARAQVNTCGTIPATLNTPAAFVTVGSTCLDLTPFIRPIAGAVGQYQIFSATPLSVGGNLLDFSSGGTQFKVDPYINFAVATTGAGTYTFTFATPITPGVYNTALSSGGVSVTDVSGGTTTIARNGAAPYIQSFGSVGSTLTGLVANVSGGPCTANAATPTSVCAYGPSGGGFTPTFFNNLEAVLTFTQTGVGRAGWSGGVSLTAVPEPSTWALVGVGLLSLGGLVRRRHAPTA